MHGCEGHLEIAQWFNEQKPELTTEAEDEHAFQSTFRNGHPDVVQLLLKKT